HCSELPTSLSASLRTITPCSEVPTRPWPSESRLLPPIGSSCGRHFRPAPFMWITAHARSATPLLKPVSRRRRLRRRGLFFDIIEAAVAARRLTAVDSAQEATRWQVAFVCVGTPSGRGGQLDARALGSVLEEIGSQLRVTNAYSVVAIRSTCLPHVFNEVVVS